MNAIRNFVHLFQDSPNFGRDRANLLSGFTIGTAALLLNAAVLFMVFPLMIEPDDRTFRAITENVEYGQLLAMILLGGASAFATVLIPLRLMTVFWGPRVSGYFDQIVLSGITPFRFVIGKATSQNLFLGLILFLLLPYLVLSLTMGGVKLIFFAAALLLLWMYCMALALVTLWLSLYFNELVSVILVIAGSSILSAIGCSPLARDAVSVTPFPLLVQPIYAAMPYFQGAARTEFLPTFISCGLGIGAIICMSLLAIYLGPLYGVVRENSTFGEVVRPGDSKRKKWFRFRQHIQRPSELAFFYENRSDTFRRWEACIRWGIGLATVTALTLVAYGVFLDWFIEWRSGRGMQKLAFVFHMVTLSIFGVSLLIGAFLFSHTKNTTLLKLQVIGSRKSTVARLDTFAFLANLIFLAALAIGGAYAIDVYILAKTNQTIFPVTTLNNGRYVRDFQMVLVQGCGVLSLAGLVVYSLHRFFCLFAWLKVPVFFLVSVAYFFLICLLPFVLGLAAMEIEAFRESVLVQTWGPTIAMMSPMTNLVFLFDEIDLEFMNNASPLPFYLVHIALLSMLMWNIRRRHQKLSVAYLESVKTEVNR